MRIVLDPFGGKAETPGNRLQVAIADNLSESDMHLSARDMMGSGSFLIFLPTNSDGQNFLELRPGAGASGKANSRDGGGSIETTSQSGTIAARRPN